METLTMVRIVRAESGRDRKSTRAAFSIDRSVIIKTKADQFVSISEGTRCVLAVMSLAV